MLYQGNSSVLSALRSGTHMLEGDIVSALLSEDAIEAMRKTDEDVDAQAFLILELLQCIALDPMWGNTPERFYSVYEDEIFFIIHLDRWANFITPCLGLPHGHRANQLIQAIKDNLASKMFKAAKMSRRLDKRFVRLSEQAHRRYYKIAYASLEKPWPKDQFESDHRSWQEHFRAREDASAKYDELFDERREALLKRLRKVSSAASPGLQGGFTEAVAKFLYNHLPIH